MAKSNEACFTSTFSLLCDSATNVFIKAFTNVIPKSTMNPSKLHCQAPLAKTSFSRQIPLIIKLQPHIMICIYPLAMAQRSESRVKFI